MKLRDIFTRLKSFLIFLAYHRRGNRLQRYTLPFVLLFIVVVAKLQFPSILVKDTPFILMPMVILISAWFGGFGPGIVATFLTSMTTNLLFLPKEASIVTTENLVRIGIFSLQGVFISMLAEAQHQAVLQKNQFIGFAGHEIRNPLAVVNGFVSMIHKNAVRENDKKITEYTTKISVYIRIITALVNDLLDISSIESGQFVYRDKLFLLNDLIKEVVTNQRLIIHSHTLVLRSKSKKYLYGDRFRIGQVLINILTNAIKYSPEEDTIIIRIKDTREGTVISVQDFGIGIPNKDHDEIYTVSYRSIPVQKSDIAGAGFGLYISYQIVKRHKGKIWYKSKVGKGTTFFLQLPTQKPPL